MTRFGPSWIGYDGTILTRETFELAVEMSLRPPPPPCGTKERPHMIHPDGGYCGTCGDGPFDAVTFTTLGYNAITVIR